MRRILETFSQVTEGRNISLTERPFVSVEDRDETVSEVDEHPGRNHHAVDTRHPLDQHQRDPDSLRQ